MFEKINVILTKWDPLSLGPEIADDEYRGFIPEIMKNMDNRVNLILYLENMLVNDLYTGYDRNNREHKESLDLIVSELMKLTH
jgi:hypothetical protein